MKNMASKIPSFLYIPLMVGGIAALIGGSIFLFWAIATVEGFVSVVMLIIAFAAAGASAKSSRYSPAKKENSSKFGTAAIITFFALMGMALDQTGNYIYNKPAEIIWCDDGSRLTREAVVSHPLPGRTDVNQAYSCVNEAGQTVESVSIASMMVLRFIEYVFIAYFAIYTMKALYFLMDRIKGDFPKQSGPIIAKNNTQ